METYREINRELILNNQELRSALAKSKREICYLNSLLIEQREKYSRLKNRIVGELQKSYKSIIRDIFQEEFTGDNSPAQTDVSVAQSKNESDSQRSKNDSRVKASYSVYEEALSTTPTHKEAETDGKINQIDLQSSLMKDLSFRKKSDDTINPIISPTKSLKDHLPKRILPGNHESDLDEYNSPNNNDSPSFTLHTLCEEEEYTANETIMKETSPEATIANATVTDATLNNLLDAPCSTPKLSDQPNCSPTLQRRSVRNSVKRKNLIPTVTLVHVQDPDGDMEQSKNQNTPLSFYNSRRSSECSLYCNEQNHTPEIATKTLREIFCNASDKRNRTNSPIGSPTKRGRIVLQKLNIYNSTQLRIFCQEDNSQSKSLEISTTTLKDEKQRPTSKRSKRILKENLEKKLNASVREVECPEEKKLSLRPRRKVINLKEPSLNTKLRK